MRSRISLLNQTLADDKLVYDLIKSETKELMEKFGQPRKTVLLEQTEALRDEDAIPNHRLGGR